MLMLMFAMDCWQAGRQLLRRGKVGNEANREITRKQIMPAATLAKSHPGKFMEKIQGGDFGGFPRKSKTTTVTWNQASRWLIIMADEDIRVDAN